MTITSAHRAQAPAQRSWRRLRRDPVATLSAATLVLVVLFAFLGPVVRPVDPDVLDLGRQLAPSTLAHPLGTDESGRDVLVRLMLGGRISLMVGLFAVLVSVSVGTLVGALAGFYGGWLSGFLMRVTDGILALPAFFLSVLTLTFFGPGLVPLVLVIGLTSWMGLARLVRGEVLKYREEQYVEAARALGSHDSRVLFRHILPQILPTLIVNASVGISTAILAESALSFLGLGIQPPNASWGNMLSGAQNYFYTAPRLAVYPGLLILITVLATNLLGDALRDATDPTD
ncbi:ABC transporter permease [Deinococcus deserti]|uniref:Putative dipeptide/oligopeptide/nickel ABC transporter, permease component n=1 Tax=Deinococcus deserti (strain DSM 17065 / CIP 109153 / LMG 22923 / VCD115) TaxID=546414 RepID=C1D2B5_DEIDV|nr:ABC transporter permease [Deinococcus deserti]ACO47554.1 putative dipeptide/oligopeptide/nickel ABC transporter, permease component [Deinococcus deserti VCD115]